MVVYTLILALEKHRQVNVCQFWASQGYTVRPCLRKEKKKKKGVSRKMENPRSSLLQTKFKASLGLVT